MNNVNDFMIENGVLIKYRGVGGAVIIPEGITGIGEMAFYNCKTLTGVVIPEGVYDIHEAAFRWCQGLKKVTFPSSLKRIDENAFSGCKSLKAVVIPAGVRHIGASAFSDVYLKELVLKGTPYIGERAFWQTDIGEVRIQAPEDLEVVPYMFQGDIVDATRKEISKGDESREADRKWLVKKLAAKKKTGLEAFFEEITPDELAVLAKCQAIHAGNADTLLALVADRPELRMLLLGIIQSSVSMEQRMAHEEHKVDLKLKKIEKRSKLLDDTLQEFQAKKPAEIKKEWTVEDVEGGLALLKYKGANTTSFVIPGSIGGKPVVSLSDEVCRAKASLASGLKSAYNKKMYKIKAVIVQDGIRRIGRNAFYGCIFMTDICLPDSVTEIQEDAFEECYKLTIHAPAGSYAEQWAIQHNIPFAVE